MGLWGLAAKAGLVRVPETEGKLRFICTGTRGYTRGADYDLVRS